MSRVSTGWLILPLLTLALVLLVIGCDDRQDENVVVPTIPTEQEHRDSSLALTIAVVCLDRNDPITEHVLQGAQDAAEDLRRERKLLRAEIRDATPLRGNAQRQAEALRRILSDVPDGVAVWAGNEQVIGPLIDTAIKRKQYVVCFGADAAKSKRLGFYGTDDALAGQRLMTELADALDEQGTIAILAGPEGQTYLDHRLEGVLGQMRKYPNIVLAKEGIVHHEFDAEQAIAALREKQRANPEITGWILLTGWALLEPDALPWKPGEVQVVAMDALPEMLSYIEDGYVHAMLAQDYYGWGYRSVEMLVHMIREAAEKPQIEMVTDSLFLVNADTLGAYRDRLDRYTLTRP